MPTDDPTADVPLSDPPEQPSSDAPRDSVGSALGLVRSDRLFLVVAVGLILLLIAMQLWRRTSTGGETVEIQRLAEQRYEFRIEINEATWVEWMQLEGIGEIMGRRIVQDREERGPFRSIEDVRRVSGIGPKTMDNIRHHLACRDCPDE